MNKLINKGIVGTLLLTALACTDLSETVYSDVTADNFFKTDEENVTGLTSAYTVLYGYAGHNGVWSINEVATDELSIPVKGNDWADGYQWVRMHRHTYNSREESFNNAWNMLYSGVNTCNRLIAQFETLGADATVAELRALRAIYYYWLMDNFGNVPLVTSFADSEPTPSNNTRLEVYTFVESELVDAAPLLSKETGTATYGRVNFYTVQAVLAELYLNSGVYKSTNLTSITPSTTDLDKAIAAADEVINSGKYSLESSYFNVFKEQNANSPEHIFAIPYDEIYGTGFNLPMMTLHYESQKTFNLTQQPWNGYATIEEFYNSYEDGDARKTNNFIVGVQKDANGVTLTDTGAEPNDPDGPTLTFTPAINELEPNAFRQAGARVGKFQFASGATNNLSNDFPVFRYAEVLMNKAEAVCRKAGNWDNATGKALLNQVRTRAGVPAFTTTTEADFLAERGRETYAEANRRQDLIRYGKYTAKYGFKITADDGAFRILFPIPFPQRNTNPNLTQNTGYSD